MMMFEQDTTAMFGELGDNLKELQEIEPNMLLETIKGWLPNLAAIGFRLLIAFLIFLVGRKLIALLQRMTRRSFERAGMEISVMKFLHSLIGFCANALLLFIILGQLGFDSASIVAILGSAGLALGLALQGSLANFAGSILILVMKPFKVGDYIISPQGEGTVSMIGLVYTTLMTIDNKAVTIPNGTLSNTPVTNVTAMDKRRLDLKVGIGYHSDLKKAKAILEMIYQDHPSIKKDPPVVVYVDELADSAVILGARGWTAADDYWTARWDIVERIKLEFDEAGIEIPFNQMDVHLIKENV